MQNHDSLILKSVYSNRYPKAKYIRNKEKYPNITYYLKTRFEYTDSIIESLARINCNLEIRPICPVCHQRVKYIGNSISPKFTKYCSSKCANICENKKQKTINTCLSKYGVVNGGCSKLALEKIKQTCLSKYGVSSIFKNEKVKQKIKTTNYKKYGVNVPSKSNIVKDKSKQTCLSKYGTSYFFQSDEFKDKSKQTCLSKYGYLHVSQVPWIKDLIMKTNKNKYGYPWFSYTHEFKDKSKQTCLSKYGTSYFFQSDEFKDKSKQTCLNKYGVKYYKQTEESKIKMSYTLSSFDIQQKIIETKRKNHTFNTSKPEEQLYEYIKLKFPSVKRQYRDKIRYPYNCDFYIPELDLFIELNGTWTHGKHPFNINSKEDNFILNTWKEKSKKHPMYLTAIKTWSISDVNKRNKAKENNLSFKEVWTLDEGKEFIDNL